MADIVTFAVDEIDLECTEMDDHDDPTQDGGCRKCRRIQDRITKVMVECMGKLAAQLLMGKIALEESEMGEGDE